MCLGLSAQSLYRLALDDGNGYGCVCIYADVRVLSLSCCDFVTFSSFTLDLDSTKADGTMMCGTTTVPAAAVVDASSPPDVAGLAVATATAAVAG